MVGEGKILWLCDTKGWVFENRAQRLAALLPAYQHEIRVLENAESFNTDGFDIIVCDFLPWMHILGGHGVHKKRIVLGMRSFRALEQYEDMLNVG